ncbi:MAG: hypothetical protein WA958_18200 [Tunicatimonas sp.]
MDTHSSNPERGRVDHVSSNAYTRAGAALLSKISWGAVLAGVIVSLVTMLALNLLGIGIGLASINPVTEASPFSGVGVGAIVWYILSNLIAIFAGGYTAARLSGIPIPIISTFHGILSWCLYTLVSFWLLTTAVGSIVSGVGSAISQTLSSAGSVITGGQNDSGQSQQSGQSASLPGLDKVTREVKQVLRQTGDPSLQPNALENRAENVAQDARQSLQSGSSLSDQEISGMLQQLMFKGGNLVDKLDQKDVASVIASRTGMSQEEANNAAKTVTRNFEEAKQDAQQLAAEAKQQANQAAAKAADAASSAAIWSFVALVLGAIVAAAGGRAGRPTEDFVDVKREENAVVR